MSNLPGGMYRRDPSSGKFIFGLPIFPASKIPLIDISKDTGTFIKAILLNREKSLGKEYYGAVDYYTPERIVNEFKEVFPEDGEGSKFQTIPDEDYKKVLEGFGMSGKVQEELLENMKLLGDEFGYYDGADLTESHEVGLDITMRRGDREGRNADVIGQFIGEPLVGWKEFIKNAPAFKGLK